MAQALLNGWTWSASGAATELVTPTAAAILATFARQTIEPGGCPDAVIVGPFAARLGLEGVGVRLAPKGD
ncbi:MAG TPA: hypothetical protein VIJ15_13085 [Dermatophilaceae bacterium]